MTHDSWGHERCLCSFILVYAMIADKLSIIIALIFTLDNAAAIINWGSNCQEFGINMKWKRALGHAACMKVFAKNREELAGAARLCPGWINKSSTPSLLAKKSYSNIRSFSRRNIALTYTLLAKITCENSTLFAKSRTNKFEQTFVKTFFFLI